MYCKKASLFYKFNEKNEKKNKKIINRKKINREKTLIKEKWSSMQQNCKQWKKYRIDQGIHWKKSWPSKKEFTNGVISHILLIMFINTYKNKCAHLSTCMKRKNVVWVVSKFFWFYFTGSLDFQPGHGNFGVNLTRIWQEFVSKKGLLESSEIFEHFFVPIHTDTQHS